MKLVCQLRYAHTDHLLWCSNDTSLSWYKHTETRVIKALLSPDVHDSWCSWYSSSPEGSEDRVLLLDCPKCSFCRRDECRNVGIDKIWLPLWWKSFGILQIHVQGDTLLCHVKLSTSLKTLPCLLTFCCTLSKLQYNYSFCLLHPCHARCLNRQPSAFQLQVFDWWQRPAGYTDLMYMRHTTIGAAIQSSRDLYGPGWLLFWKCDRAGTTSERITEYTELSWESKDLNIETCGNTRGSMKK